ncbi:hypothetical protein D3C71_1101310 [compost metagenome]
MPVTLTAPAPASTSTMPDAPWNTANVGLGWKRPFSVPSSLVQFSPSVRHVPEPPSMTPSSRRAGSLPSQKLSVAPAVDIRLTCPLTAVWIRRSLAMMPVGAVPMASVLDVSAPR